VAGGRGQARNRCWRDVWVFSKHKAEAGPLHAFSSSSSSSAARPLSASTATRWEGPTWFREISVNSDAPQRRGQFVGLLGR
jgi:hypothetical protein